MINVCITVCGCGERDECGERDGGGGGGGGDGDGDGDGCVSFGYCSFCIIGGFDGRYGDDGGCDGGGDGGGGGCRGWFRVYSFVYNSLNISAGCEDIYD